MPVLKISFPEGWSAGQMADRAAEVRQIAIKKRGVTPLLSGSSYAAATRAGEVPLLSGSFLKRRSVEGLPLPFRPTSSSRRRAQRASSRGRSRRFGRRWASVDLRPREGAQESPYAVLIIASLIEKETVAPSERALVAAVIDNRLEQGMPLAIDASLRYGLGVEGTRPLKQSNLRSNTPYNTHRFKGLPPTPITNLACRRCAPLRSPRRSTT